MLIPTGTNGAKTIMANQANEFFSNNVSSKLPDATNLQQCKCKISQHYLEKTSQTQGLHQKKLSPKSRGYSLPLSPLVNNHNIYSKKPPSGFSSSNVVTTCCSSSIVEPSFRIGGKTDHYPGRFSFSHPRFFYTLTNPQFSSAGGGGLHAEERLDIMSDSYKSLDHEMDVDDGSDPVFYFGNSNSSDNHSAISFSHSTPNSFANSISRRRKLTQSLSGLSSPGAVRNKLSPVREHDPSTSSNVGSPTTPTNPLVCLQHIHTQIYFCNFSILVIRTSKVLSFELRYVF